MIHHGDLFDVLPTLAAESVDALVSDPPYGIGFMGKQWDTFKPGEEAKRIVPNRAIDSDNPNLRGRTRGPASSPSAIEYDYSVAGLRGFQKWTEEWAVEVFRVMKPGAYGVVCGAPRAYHRMACGLEDAGFEIRDCLSWLFGSGFPKSLNLGDGRGTALKPAHEPIVLIRKPFKGSVKANVAKHGTGALNIDACRLATTDVLNLPGPNGGLAGPARRAVEGRTDVSDGPDYEQSPLGRWPANVCLDEEAAAMLDEMSGNLRAGGDLTGNEPSKPAKNVYGEYKGRGAWDSYGDSGGASRFYYVAKPSRSERDEGIYDLAPKSGGAATDRTDGSAGLNSPRAGAGRNGTARNIHPTVKPVELMRWLIRLITPPGGVVLDPFLGSGTTGMAARYELREFIGIEREAEYVAIAERRIASVAPLFAATVTDGEAHP
jgi:DNA modification methylase